MPTTVRALFDAAGILRGDSVPWGETVSERAGGVYVVALEASPDGMDAALSACPISSEALKAWLEAHPELQLDGRRPAPDELAARLTALWLPDEVILYVGKAASLAARVDQYYVTPLGARRPHAGGHFLKTLSNLDEVHVHFGTADDPAASEYRMLDAFCAGVSEPTREVLHDPDHPFPFANLEWPAGTRKRHGITGGRASRPKAPSSLSHPGSSREPLRAEEVSRSSAGLRYRTQRVTANDLSRGQIRIPVSGATKMLFPATKSTVIVDVRGSRMEASWDPRLGPDRERSGVLRFPMSLVLKQLVSVDEVLQASTGPSGAIVLS